MASRKSSMLAGLVDLGLVVGLGVRGCRHRRGSQ